MDEDTAWEAFVSSGRVQDYLLYRQAKNCIEQRYFGKGTEDGNEIEVLHTGVHPEGADN